jgi:hypothetical protein
VLPWNTDRCKCPSCGEKAVEYILVGDLRINLVWALIWCSVCKDGTFRPRVTLHPKTQLKVIPFEESEDVDEIMKRHEINLVLK